MTAGGGRRVKVDVSDLRPGSLQRVHCEGREILLCNAQGEYYAVGERCSHAAVSLADGRLRGYRLECPRHGGCFDVRDGRTLRGPARDAIPSYRVHRVADGIEVEIPGD